MSKVFDVVVIGSGPAGLMATLRAAQQGKKVALIESENQIGGTGRGSAYGMWIPQNRLIRELGVKEDKELCLKWMCKHAYPDEFDEQAPLYGIPDKDYVLFEQYFDSSGEMLDFLLDETDLELVYMRNHADDFDTYERNSELIKQKCLPNDEQLMRALPDYHPEDEFNEVPVGRYVNLKSNAFSIMCFFLTMFRYMEFKRLFSGLVEMMMPQVLWQVFKGFFGKNDEGAFYYCGSGIRVTHAFKQLLSQYKVPIFLEYTLERILFDKVGAVEAVCVESKGKQYIFKANNIILTVGGFAHNKNLIKKYAPEFPVQTCVSRPGCTGIVLASLEDTDVQLGHMNDVWQTESVLELAHRPVHISDITGPANVWHLNGDSAFVVDQQGFRCYDESSQYSMRSKWYRSPDKEITIYFFDQRMIKHFGGLMGTWSAHLPYLTAIPALRPSFILEGKSVEELTGRLKEYLRPFQQSINCELSEKFSENLQQTIVRYNRFARCGVDKDFNRGSSLAGLGWRAKRAKDNHYPNKTMYPISTEGPYYAIVLCLSCFNTKGGFQTNEHAQVLRVDDTPIPGLYAAGNCAASPSNVGYVLSTIGPAMTYAYVAANHIVEPTLNSQLQNFHARYTSR